MSIDPAKLKHAVTLRASGYSLAAIAEKTGISSATLFRQLKASGVTKGTLKVLTVSQASNQLLEDAGFINELKQTIASSIVDELTINRRIREAITLSVEELLTETDATASIKLRALASASTALSVSQSIARKALNLEKIDPFTNPDTLPQLTIWKMSDEQVVAMRAASDSKDDDD
jgi:AraC-like DNA-binding protein